MNNLKKIEFKGYQNHELVNHNSRERKWALERDCNEWLPAPIGDILTKTGMARPGRLGLVGLHLEA